MNGAFNEWLISGITLHAANVSSYVWFLRGPSRPLKYPQGHFYFSLFPHCEWRTYIYIFYF